jgi:hypothetical protein
MTTQEMLTILQSTPDTEATASSSIMGQPMRAWVSYVDDNRLDVSIAIEEQHGESTVFRAITSVPMRDDWELATQ